MRSPRGLTAASGLLLTAMFGWAIGQTLGAIAALVVGIAFALVPFRGSALCTRALLYARRNRAIRFADLVTVANDETSAGVRCVDGMAIVAIQILGKAHQITRLVGSAAAETTNTLDLQWLFPALKQSLGITLDSISVVIAGSRRGALGDYPRIYDTLIGPSPYAGHRETWLVLRVPDLANGEALQWRTSLGSAAVACGQRTAAMLRQHGLRARVATASDIAEFERRMGRDGLGSRNRHWDALRTDNGWLVTYAYRTAYRTAELDTDRLCQAWLWQADGVIQNVTLLPDRSMTATVTVRSNHRPTCAPSTALEVLRGEQAPAAALNMCVARRDLRGAVRGPAPGGLVLPVGESGVLIGKDRTGGRLLLPLGDPAEESRVHIAADDRIAQRLVMRLAGAGAQITVHTRDIARWKRLRMPNLAVTDGMRSAVGTTVSVVDGTVSPAPRPRTVISIGPPRAPAPSADVLLVQIAPQTLRVTAAGLTTDVDVEMFRVEKRYLPVGTNELN